jgi:hypothetical protein
MQHIQNELMYKYIGIWLAKCRGKVEERNESNDHSTLFWVLVESMLSYPIMLF